MYYSDNILNYKHREVFIPAYLLCGHSKIPSDHGHGAAQLCAKVAFTFLDYDGDLPGIFAALDCLNHLKRAPSSAIRDLGI